MAAMCLDKDLAYFLSSASIYEVILEFTDFKVSGTIRCEISTNNHNSFPTSAVSFQDKLFFADISENGGIFSVNFETGIPQCALKATENSSPYGLCIVNNELYYSNVKRRQICIIDLEQEQVTSAVTAGNGDAK